MIEPSETLRLGCEQALRREPLPHGPEHVYARDILLIVDTDYQMIFEIYPPEGDVKVSMVKCLCEDNFGRTKNLDEVCFVTRSGHRFTIKEGIARIPTHLFADGFDLMSPSKGPSFKTKWEDSELAEA